MNSPHRGLRDWLFFQRGHTMTRGSAKAIFLHSNSSSEKSWRAILPKKWPRHRPASRSYNNTSFWVEASCSHLCRTMNVSFRKCVSICKSLESDIKLLKDLSVPLLWSKCFFVSHLKNCNSWDKFIHFNQSFHCHYVSVSLLCHCNRDDLKVSCCWNGVI